MRATKKAQQGNSQAEIVEAVRALAQEKDISVDMLFNAIEEALKAAYKKNVSRDEDAPSNLSVTIDRSTGVVHVFARKTITDAVEDSANQITLEDALKIRHDYRMDDIAEIDVTPAGFLRTAAQTAKQVIMQRIREAEQGKIYDEYSEKENEILTAIVQRVEPKSVYVELGRTEGIMEQNEWMPGEEYHIDDHIKVYVLEVNRTGREMLRGPQVRVSRVHVGLVKRLFEMEVPEIAAGVVQIKSIAREAGSRTKMAVHSTEVSIDPVGACVGPRGNRVEKVVAELKNEKIDIIKWSPDPAEFIANALNPAHVLSVFVAENEKACRVVVPDNQLSLAIGKEGQNARLAAKLTGWRIDIKSQSQAAQMFDLPMEEVPEEPLGFQAYYDENAPVVDMSESGLPELRDVPLEMPDSGSEDDTL
ncbi:MAG: transcription termination factor NusA [Clostridia bacterium]